MDILCCHGYRGKWVSALIGSPAFPRTIPAINLTVGCLVKAVCRIAVLSALLGGCATLPQPVVEPLPAPVVLPGPIAPSPSLPAAPPAAVTTAPVTTAPPSQVSLLPQAPVATVPGIGEAQARALLLQLLPPKISDRAGWSKDILGAFTGLRIPYEAQYFCAAIAVIEQESSWQSDPTVPGLNKMVWKEIGKRADKYHIPLVAVQAALLKPSPDGRSYKARIDSLQTEKQMNAVFEDMVADAARLGLPLDVKNPIRTGGPMQVSVEFAEGHVRAWPYPYSYKGSVRQEVFTRRGGLYFGIANLLHYRVNYPQMIYRFADFNAGRYSSRNAAFQAALVRLSKQKMALDGDLLIYQQGRPSSQQSTTQKWLQQLAPKLGLSSAEIERDLRLEKAEAFSQTQLFKRLFELASQQAGHPLPQQVMPQIRLVSPKITRKLTTEWFAKRVDGRYQTCLARQPLPVNSAAAGVALSHNVLVIQ